MSELAEIAQYLQIIAEALRCLIAIAAFAVLVKIFAG